MNIRNLAVVSAVVAGLFGLTALLVPAQFLALSTGWSFRKPAWC